VFSSYGGAVDQTAVIGHPPEHRAWKPGDPCWQPRVAPTARVEAYVTVDAGMVHPTEIGDRAWLMKHSHVGHDAVIGAGAEIAPGAVICGHAEIGADVKVGVNASVLPFVKVGAGARIGAGAVVIADVPAGEVWAGNPARYLRAADRSAELV
jgi:acyl-[acyl carrier protein]--UDP-N-acetylglucosamine O-acyltransferase